MQRFDVSDVGNEASGAYFKRTALQGRMSRTVSGNLYNSYDRDL